MSAITTGRYCPSGHAVTDVAGNVCCDWVGWGTTRVRRILLARQGFSRMSWAGVEAADAAVSTGAEIGTGCGKNRERQFPRTRSDSRVRANGRQPNGQYRRRSEIARQRVKHQMPMKCFDSHRDSVNEKDRCANTSPLQESSFAGALGTRSDSRQTA